MRFRAPTFVSLLLFSVIARADFDLAIGSTLRSYPLSGVLEVESGYGAVLYGSTSSPFYGYIRPRIDLASAATYNSGAASLEVFPLAFLGARAGGESIQNDQEYTAYECEVHACLGRYYRTYFEGELSLGAGSVFVQGKWRRERWTQGDKTAGDFIEPTSGLAMPADGESQSIYIGVLGIRWSPRWLTLAGLRYAESENGISRLPYAALRFRSGSWSIGAGGGLFESSLKKREFTALGFLRWEIAPAVGLR